MTDSHAKLFEPFTLNNGVTLQSRLVIAPHALLPEPGRNDE